MYSEPPPPPPPDDADEDIPPPPPPDDDAPPPPPPEPSVQPQQQPPDDAAIREKWSAYILACKEAGYDVSQYEASLQAGTSDASAPAASSSQRPSWLQEIVEQGGARSRSRSPDRDAAPASSSGNGQWDERWGYAKQREWKGPSAKGGKTGPGIPPPGPRKGLFLQRCPAWAGGKGKCKRGACSARCALPGTMRLLPSSLVIASRGMTCASLRLTLPCSTWPQATVAPLRTERPSSRPRRFVR